MKQSAYCGHESQLFGVEEYRLTGGKGDGMRLLQVRNGKGLDFTVSADRCADISRLHFRGENCGFFSANGYVAPAYYDDKEAGWLKNFTAGFLTTCGLLAVGSPCTDEGVRLPLHGAVDNIPAERLLWDMDDEKIWVKAVMRHAQIFAEKLILTRTITCSKQTNEITITDEIENVGGEASPVMILYHMNMGYPMLSIAGLNISTRCFANFALFILRINSSVFPENIEPQITSIRPLLLVSCMWSSENNTMRFCVFLIK